MKLCPSSPAVSSPDESSTLVDLLRRAAENPDKAGYIFLTDGEIEGERLCYGDLDARARAIAVRLRASMEPGARALLLFPPGLDFVAAFFGCLYAGVVAVPAYPPRPRRSPARLQGLLEDARPSAVLTVGSLAAHADGWSEELPALGDLAWIAVDELGTDGAEDWEPPAIDGDTLAFLQYTSGSTSAPKGVMVSHGNLLHNQKLIQEAFRQTEESVIVSWLPMYHDMGLIGTLLQPLYAGARCYLMAPTAFLLRPLRWLQAISKYRATTSGAPNFAYDLCVSRISPEQRAGLDLSSWRVAFNGAEPVRGATLSRFAEAFAPCGFRAESFHPCYGLAEATLLVAVSGARLPRSVAVDAAELERNRVRPADGGRELVSCGAAAGGQRVQVVDPESLQPCAPGRVGEIWVSGPSVARGYWERDEPTRQIFQARLAGGSAPFLRTGDLGFFLGGELFITGRIKDLIILRGRNHYPQDIELTVEASHPALRLGCGAAFAVAGEGEERLVVVHEVERRADADPAAVAEAVRQAVAGEHEVAVHEVVLLRAGTIPKTTSGKIQRGACRGLYLSGGLEVVARSAAPAAGAAEEAVEEEAGSASPLETLLRREAARLLRLPPSRVPVDQPLARLGLDSLTALQMAGRVEEALGVRLPLDLLLAEGTLAEIAAELLPRIGEAPSPVEVPAGFEISEGPLTYGQSALWFLQRLAPDSSAYHIAAAARLVGGADAPSLRRAFQALIDRHPALRTTFPVVGEVPQQRVAAAAEVDFAEIDGSAWGEEELAGRLAEEARRPFDLERGPLLRVALVHTGAEPVLLLAVHHIVSDFWSLAVLLRELGGLAAAFRRGEEPAGQVPPAVSPLDWAVREQAWLEGPEGERLWSWWREELAGPLPDLDLPTDRPRPTEQSFRGDVRRRRLGGSVEAVGRAQGATLFATLAAAFQVLLHRMSGQDEILLGAPAAGRTAPELAGTVGYFVNPVVLRADLGGDPPFASHLARVRCSVLGALAHQAFPFPLLAERLQPVRDAGRSPLFQAMLVLQQGGAGDDPALAAFALGEPGARVRAGELELEYLPLPESAAQLDLTLSVARCGEGLAVSCQYATDLFDGATIERLLGHFETLLEGIAVQPDHRVGALPLLSAPEREQILRAWNATGSAALPGVRLHDLVRAQAERTPEAVALVARDESLTYGELARRAGDLARRLRGLGVGPEVRVGIFQERSARMVVSLLGVLEAGGAYVPLDPSYPPARLALMLEDSGAAFVLSDEDWPTPGEGVLTGGAEPAPDNLAYLIYTSGSTGRPKAVAIEHRSAVALAVWAREAFPPEDLAGVLASTSICFDLSVFELFVPLAWGGRVILVDNALALPTVADQGVTLVNTVPSAMVELVREGRLPETVRAVVLAGEPLKGSLVRQIHAAGCARVFNLYGPSEDTTYSTFAAMESAGPERSPIGRPIAGSRAYVLDRRGEPVPTGVPGELFLAGEGLARGYLGRPEATAERFVPDPFGGGGERLYRTGDLARWLPGGSLDFLGRVDHQVKVRGFRIELGEIEAALARHPRVREAVVLADLERGRLVGCVVLMEGPAEGALGVLAGELRAFLRASLPEHMVPTAWVWLDALPLTPNGKIDRRALAAGSAAVEAGDPLRSVPATPLEELLAAIWSDVLGVERVAPGESFFELGGHSLLATRVMSRIRSLFGIDLPLRALFQAPTVEGLARLVEGARTAGAAAPPPIVPVPRAGEIPLSFAQQRLWFLAQLDPRSPAYNMPAALRLTGALDRAALAASLGEVVARHEVLRTTFAGNNGDPVQRIAPAGPAAVSAAWPLPLIDLEGLEESLREAEAGCLIREEALRPFDLERGPLMRAALLRRTAAEHDLLLTMHHVAFDGWSTGVLIREVAALYPAFAAGRPSPLGALPVQYADFAVWQRGWLAGETLDAQLAFWRGHLADAPPALDLPTDRARTPGGPGRGGVASTPLSVELRASLAALGRRQGSTLFMTLLAAWKALLGRSSGQDDLVVGSPIANRNRAEIEGLIGFFVNTLALRTRIADEPSFLNLLARVRDGALGAYAHQDLPFEKLVEELAPERSLARTPLFQVMFVLQNAPAAALELPGLTLALLETDGGAAKLDLSLSVAEKAEGLAADLTYDSDLFDGATAEHLLSHFGTLLEAIIAAPDRPVGEFPLLCAAEQEQVLREWNATGSAAQPGLRLHDLFAAQAERTPEAVALVARGESLTYAELAGRAGSLAGRLRRLGVGPEVRVGVFLERTTDLVVSLLGILQAGGAYVPLDPAYPAARIALMLEDSGAALVLSQESLASRLPATPAEVLLLDAETGEGGAEEDAASPETGAGPDNLAYLIYTSGSTGRPKAVAIEHRSAVALAVWAREVFVPEDLAGVLAGTSICFDLSVFELFVPLAWGGRVILVDNALALPTVAELGVTLVNTVPSAIAELVREGRLPATVRTVSLAGEPLKGSLVRQILAAGPAQVLNLYGPSEDTTYSTFAAMPMEGPERRSIGRPIAGTRAYVLDRRMETVPVRVAGELYLAGEGLARGYLGRPEVTAERFVPDPFGGPGERLYRTGDLARWLPGGSLDFLGRVDHQVKVRGFRIELGEIEAALARHPRVCEAVVLADPEQGRLVGCVVTGEAEGSLAGELRAFLRGSLPEHMVPTAWVWLDALPLTPNGKIDRRALAARIASVEAGGPRESGLSSPAEELLAAIWSEVLGVERIGRGDDFFELGGHSLLATRVASRISRTFGVELPVRALFEAPTVAALAERIAGLAAAATPAITPAPRDGAIPLSFAQQRLWFLDQLEPGSPAYNIPVAMRLSGALDVAALAAGLDEIVARHEALRTRFEQVNTEPVQHIDAPRPGLFPLVDLSGLVHAEDEIRRIMAAEALRPFDLARGPLLRATLLRQSGQEHVVLLTLHHIVSDGWSMDVLIRELAVLYGAFSAGQPSPLAALPVQYADFAVWQRAWLRGEVMERQLAFWRERLAGAPPVLELPADRPRPAVRSGRGGTVPVRLPAELIAALEALGRRERSTLFMVLLASWETLLARITGQTDLVVGSPIANRQREEIEGLIGFFVNTLALRTGLSLQEPFGALVGRIREATLAAYMHQDLPFERLVEELAPGRNRSTTPLFQVMLVLQNASREELRLPGLTFAPLEIDSGTAKLDLTLILREDGSGWLEFSRDLFDRATAARIAGWFETLAAGVADAGSDLRLNALPLLTETERRELLVEKSRRASAYPREASLHRLFEEQADRTPEAVALSWESGELTYRELDRKASRLARALIVLGVGPEVVVGVLAERSPDLIVALLAILKAGGAYAPLDPALPAERLAFLLADTRSPIVLTQEHLADRLPDTPARVVRLEALEAGAESDARPDVPVSAEGLAYVMYTSGSTGLPKGVAVVHRAVVRLVRGTSFADFGPSQVWAQLAPASFDASTLEIWAALLHGGRLAVLPPAASTLAGLGEALERQGVTSLWLTAGLFHQMVEENLAGLAPVRQLLAGGDALSPEHVRTALAGLPGTRVINGYGPTENTTFTCCHPMTSPGEVTAPVSLGLPIANTQVWLLDGELQPVPVGVAGELYAGGDGLARGYLGRPALTAERFVPSPWTEEPGSRLYRTGDLARWRPDGTVDFLGRIDRQVKLRGFRVEPGEIEAVLAGHPSVREAAVVVQGEGAGKRLVAFVAGAPELDAASLRGFLEPRLPSWMVPSAFVSLEALPLTPNGKVDRRALAARAPEEAAGAGSAAAAPRTPVEELLAAVWAEVLGRESVGIHDDFFALGGHSLLATRVIARVRALFRVELPLSALFETPTVAGLAAAVETARAVGGGAALAPPIVPVPRDVDLPLSFAQQRLWFIHQLEPASPAYNIPAAVRLRGVLERAALAASLDEIAARHEVLRTRFESVDGEPFQRIDPPSPGALPLIDLSGLADAATEARRLAADEAARPFDLVRGPLFRSTLLRLGASEHLALLTQHHLASDGWSMGVLVDELAALYPAFVAGRPSPLPPLPVQYADFAVWQRSWLSHDVLESRVGHWRERLAGAPPVLELSTDRPRGGARGRGGAESAPLTGTLYTAAQALARREGATLFMVLLAAWKTVLARFAGQEDLVVGTPIANRTRAEIEGLIGFFVNTLALRTDLGADPAFAALLGRVREGALDAYAHQDVPFEKLVEELAPERSLDRTPLFQVMLVLQNTPGGTLELPGLALDVLETGTGAAKLDLSLMFATRDEGMTGTLTFDGGLFDAATARRLLGGFRTLLAAAVADPERPLSELPLLGAAELAQVLVAWNDSGAAGADGRCLHERFEEWADRTPDAPALAFEGTSLTCAEVEAWANRLAHRLRALGVGPEVPVALCVERSPEMIVGLLAILKAGGAYVPLDPDLPEDRLAFVLADSGSRVLLAQRDGRLPALSGVRPEWVDRDSPALSAEPAGRLAGGAEPQHLAYVIYTSGSTGRPKGVAVEHRQVASYVEAVLERLALPPGSSFATVSTIAADLGNTVVFAALATGGTLHVISAARLTDPEAMAEHFERFPVDCLKIVPSHLAALLEARRPERLLPRRALVLGGEASRWGFVERLRKLAPGCRVLNHYGPTETTVGVLTHEPGSAPSERRSAGLPLGRPLRGTRIYLLGRGLQPVPPGTPGEVYAGGSNVTRGYVGRPGLTAERFLPDPFGGEPGARLYRTGDRARHLPDGLLEFLGRADDQVKIRGHRVEPGEVAAALRLLPGVREAVVLPHGGADGWRLVAFVVAGGDAAPGRLREALRESLPEAMIPGAWVALPALPLTPNGKVDRSALALLADAAMPAAPAAGEVAAPRTPVEEIVAAIWADLLGHERIGIHDDFFDLGGHSLLATRVIARIRAAFDVDLPLRAIFETPTVAGIAAAVEAAVREGIASAPPIMLREAGTEDLPLSFSQQRLWFLDQLQPGNPAYNVPAALRLTGRLDDGALQASLDEIVARHEVLRATFGQVAGEPVQRIAPAAPLPVPRIDLSALPELSREREARRLAVEEALRPFDLERGPSLRARLLRLGREEHAMLFTLHHIVSDGWSRTLLVREVGVLYAAFTQGLPSPLPPLPVQYPDYALWQRGWLSGEPLAGLVGYWRERLAASPAELALPTDRPRSLSSSGRGGLVRSRLSADLASAIAAVTRGAGATLFMTLLAAWKTLLQRLTGQGDLVVGTPIANRNRLEIEELIGFFVNTLVLRTDVSDEPGFPELLGRVREGALAAYAHQDLPFEKLVEELAPERHLGRTPLFQVMFVLQNAPAGALELPGLALELLEGEGTAAKFDLTLTLAEDADGIAASLEFDRDLFDGTTAARLQRCFGELLAGIAGTPGARPADLPLLSAAERHQVLVEWNATEAEQPVLCLHELVAAQVARTPDAVAVVSEDGSLTYRELWARGGALSRRLRRLGVRPEVVVGVCAERSLEMVVGLLGVLEAGAAYLPLDPSYPPERLAFQVADAGAPIVLAQERLLGRLGALPPGARIELLSAAGAAPISTFAPLARRASGAGPDHLAYVIYTSGSTGRPKGVMVPHRGVCNRLLWAQGVYALGAGDAVLQKAAFGFDFSVWEIFAPLLAGARLVLARPEGHKDPAYLVRAIARQGITCVHFVPSMLWAFLEEEGVEECASLRQVFVGGEALSPELRDRFFARLGVPLDNQYGPTEISIDTTRWVCAPGQDPRRVPIGRPIANARLHVADAGLRAQPVGVPGELLVGGPGVVRGYLGRPELTADRFVPDPWSAAPGERLYRTGDLARLLADGTLEFLGRVDQQVKVRGLRIELGEIESALAAQAGVREAAVGVRGTGALDQRLVAWVVPASPGALDAAGLRRSLAERLPDYMVPGTFVELAALPLTSSGKLDRRALPEPEASATPGEAAAPRNPVEEVLAGLWAEVLGLERVGVDSDFFALGGHSLLATRLMSRVREAFAVDVPLRTLFEAPTVAGFAVAVQAALGFGAATAAPPVAPVPRACPDGQDEALPLSFAQQRLWFIHQLEPESPAYNIPVAVRLRGALDPAALAASLDEIVARHEALRTTFGEEAGEAVQRIAPPAHRPLPLIDLSGVPDRELEALRLAAGERRRSFDLTRGPLVRWTLVRSAPDEHALLLTLHHIVSDGWSSGVLIHELASLYQAFAAGTRSPLPPLPVQYADFAVWQRQWLQGDVLDAQLGYWRTRLAGAPPVLELPADHPRPAAASGRGGLCRLEIDAGLRGAAAAFSRRQGGTLFMTLLAAWKTLLVRVTGQADLTVGTPIANRQRIELEGLIGFFANTLALRTGIPEGSTFRALAGRVREGTLAAYAHQDLPFERLVEELAPERSLSHTPLFQVMLAFQSAPAAVMELPGLTLEPFGEGDGEGRTAKFDLSLFLSETGDGLTAALEHSLDLFEPATAARMLERFEMILEAAVAAPDRCLSDLPLLTAAELRQLDAWNATVTPLDEAPVHRRFEIRARQSPEAIAVLAPGGEALSYAEVDRLSDRLARRLQGFGVGPDVPVGICLERGGWEGVVCLLGVLKAGGCSLPLDPGYPLERLGFMLADAGAPVLITRDHLAARLPAHPARVLSLDAGWPGDGAARHRPFPEAAPESLSYLIYTSGSTGRPKGVALPHRTLANLIAWQVGASAAPAGRTLQFASPSFDVSFQEVFATWAAGGTLVLVDEERRADPEALLHRIREAEVERLFLPFVALQQLAEAAAAFGGAPVSLREVVTAGEQLQTTPEVAALFAALPGCVLRNQYGPSETHVVTEHSLWSAPVGDPAAWPALPPIGLPIANTGVHLVNRGGNLVPVGVPGEAWLGGSGLARGYLGRPELTAEKLVPSPWGDGERLYRSGDLARRRASGEIEFLGRIDQQVKIRGFRVELGEIETALAAHGAVREAVVVARGTAAGRRLTAYILPSDFPAGGMRAVLRRFLEERLPDYMIPADFVPVEAFPLTPSGKIDRRNLALHGPEPDSAETGTVEPPRTPAEELLADIWARVLGRDRVGRDQGFFDLGGHSLLALRVVSHVRAIFQVELPLRGLFESPTVEGMAGTIADLVGGPEIADEIALVYRELENMSDDQAQGLLLGSALP